MTTIRLDVDTRVNPADLTKSAAEIQRSMHKAGQAAGQDFGNQFGRGIQQSSPRVVAAMNGVTGATRTLREEQQKLAEVTRSGNWDKILTQSTNVTRAYANQRSALSEVRSAMSEFDNAASQASRSAQTLAGTASEVGGAFAKAAGPAAMGAAILGLEGLAGVAASASGAVGLLPGVLTAAGAAFGTVKLATLGFGDALDAISDPKKFAAALQSLSPNAQQAALSIRALLPAFDQLKNATQQAFFANVGPQLNQLANTLLPTITQMTTGIAGAFNQMFSGLSQQLQNPQTLGALQNIGNNVVAAFQNLAPAVAPLTQAFAQLTSVGSDFLPQLASAATEAAQAFAQFINEASQSGQLKEWIGEGLETLRQLVPVGLDLAKAFLSLAPVGEKVMPLIVDSVHLLAQAIPPIATVASKISPLFLTWKIVIDQVKGAVDVLGSGFHAIGGIVQGVGNVVIPIINNIGGALNTALAPIRAAAALVGINIPTYSPIAPIGSPSSTLGGDAGGSAAINRTSRTPATAGLPGVPASGYQFPYTQPSLGRAGQDGLKTYSWGSPPPAASGGGGGGGIPTAPSSYSTPSLGSINSPADLAAGSSRVAYLYQVAQSLQGTPYSRALRNDCSGMVSELAAAALGMPIPSAGQRFSTANEGQWLASHGFLPGLGGPGDLSIGWVNGGPGGGHTAATLPNGVNAEQGGANNSFTLGAGAHGAAGFPNAMHLPMTNDGAVPVSIQDVASGAFPSDTSSTGGQLGVGLDQDLGISKGLPGLAENLVRFLGDLLMAPVLAAIHQFTGGKGIGETGMGLIGMMNAGPSPLGASPMGGSGMLGALPAQPLGTPASGYGMGLPPGPAPAAPGWAGPTGLPTMPAGFGGQGYPGAPGPGIGAAATQPVGQAFGEGGWQPQGGGFGVSGGGLVGAGMAAAAGAGGGGAGAGLGAAMAGMQTVEQLINRTIAFGGQAANIGVSGILETFGLNDSPLSDLSKSWYGKVASGLAGARPAVPTGAGKQPNQDSGKQQEQQQAGAPAQQGGQGGPMVNIENFVQAQNRNGRQTANDLGWMAKTQRN